MNWYYPIYRFLVSLNESDEKLLAALRCSKKYKNHNQTDIIRKLIREESKRLRK